MKEFVEKLIGRLEENTIYDKQAIGFINKYGRGIGFISKNKAISIVNQLAEEYINSSTNGWISVKDRLPIEEGSYLVVGKTGGATVTRWYEPSQFHPQGHFGGNSSEYIRYWMPRPQAPTQNHCSTKQTNADRIRSMSDLELSNFIKSVHNDGTCREYALTHGQDFTDMFGNKGVMQWLQSEVKGSE